MGSKFTAGAFLLALTFVVFSQYVGIGQGDPLAPGTVQTWRGNWQKGYANITRKSEALHHDDGTFKSPYAELSSQGPTIVDRRLFFIETVPHTAMLPAANTTSVRPRLTIIPDSEEHLFALSGGLSRACSVDWGLSRTAVRSDVWAQSPTSTPENRRIEPTNRTDDRRRYCFLT